VNYISGNENGYDLSRLRGGFTVKPTPWVSTYIQFHDAHALDLPLVYTASNMKDNFDFRQAYLEFKVPHADIKAGRQELRFGGERLVGVSDWTNVSRTFDAVSGKFGGAIDNVTLSTSTPPASTSTAPTARSATCCRAPASSPTSSSRPCPTSPASSPSPAPRPRSSPACAS